MNLEKIAQYRLIRRETLTDIHTEGYLLEHRKTHARVLVLENDEIRCLISPFARRRQTVREWRIL